MVQTMGACQSTNGACGTGRGSGTPVRPPTVWVKWTLPCSTTGSCRSTGREYPPNVAPTLATRTVVEPMTMPDSGVKPHSSGVPSSSNSAHAPRWLAKRNRSSARRRWTWSRVVRVSTGGLS
nr:hypothetical protein DA06_12640 [Georgenia sp. SUBG003]